MGIDIYDAVDELIRVGDRVVFNSPRVFGLHALRSGIVVSINLHQAHWGRPPFASVSVQPDTKVGTYDFCIIRTLDPKRVAVIG